MSLAHVTRLVCVKCRASYGLEVATTCPVCGLEGILDIEYDYEEVARTLDRRALERREPWMWRYKELIPVDEMSEMPHLQVGWSPVYGAPRLAEHVGVAGLWIKDEGRNPTACLKDRASAVGVVKAKERGAKAVACASTGNAASSLAGFAAAAGLPAFAFVPETAPDTTIAQSLVYGAHVFKVRDTYDGAWRLCQAACEAFGWYNRNSAVNPYLVEGEKTCGLEIGEQLADKMPDWVAVAVGDGCSLAGIHKGLKEMRQLHIAGKAPKMLGVQAIGAAPVADAFEKEGFQPVEGKTLADSICVGAPRNWRRAVAAVRESGGTFVRVSDEEIVDAMRETAHRAAVHGEPAAAAAVAGLRAAVRKRLVTPQETALVVITGNGLKNAKTPATALPAPAGIPNDLESLTMQLKRSELV